MTASQETENNSDNDDRISGYVNPLEEAEEGPGGYVNHAEDDPEAHQPHSHYSEPIVPDQPPTCPSNPVTRSCSYGRDGLTLQYPIITRSDQSAATPASLTTTWRRRAQQFLGLDEEDGDEEQLWAERRIRLANRHYGGVNATAGTLPWPHKNYKVDSPDGDATGELATTFPSSTYPRSTKPSVASYMVNTISTLGRKISGRASRVGSIAHSTISRSYRHQDIVTNVETDSVPSMPYSPAYRPQDELFFRDPRATNYDQQEPQSHVGLSRMHPALLGRDSSATLNDIMPDDTVDKREYGIGAVGELFGRDYRTIVRNQPHIQKQLDEMDDYRPYFTYWVTTVQIVIMIASIVLYGFGPIGVELKQSAGHVLARGLYLEEVDYLEPANFWLGPRAADLIHLGAKFAPCMRRDDVIVAEREAQLARERDTGCCVRNDHSGCAQTSRDECSTLVSTFYKWSESRPGPDGRMSGPVCGQDPLYCSAPLSSYANTWPDDITHWPVCRRSVVPEPVNFWGLSRQTQLQQSAAPPHMTCERIARPCCIGIHGKCEIRTKEFCDFVHGYFHPEATLCSQVSCIGEVCGMLPFFMSRDNAVPDQFYRLFTSIFLHAGLIHLVITLVVQLYLMRDMEKLCGPFRMAVIYLGSGAAGNLASAIFVPYRAEAGPAGAQFGLVSSLVVEIIHAWPVLKSPGRALGKMLAILAILFLLGFLPWVDNYAHITGFLTGFMLSYAFMPYVSFERRLTAANATAPRTTTRAGTRNRRTRRRCVLVSICLSAVVVLFTVLFLVFYLVEVTECTWCKYLTCIPFTQDFCADQNINFRKDEPIINF